MATGGIGIPGPPSIGGLKVPYQTARVDLVQLAGLVRPLNGVTDALEIKCGLAFVPDITHVVAASADAIPIRQIFYERLHAEVIEVDLHCGADRTGGATGRRQEPLVQDRFSLLNRRIKVGGRQLDEIATAALVPEVGAENTVRPRVDIQGEQCAAGNGFDDVSYAVIDIPQSCGEVARESVHLGATLKCHRVRRTVLVGRDAGCPDVHFDLVLDRLQVCVGVDRHLVGEPLIDLPRVLVVVVRVHQDTSALTTLGVEVEPGVVVLLLPPTSDASASGVRSEVARESVHLGATLKCHRVRRGQALIGVEMLVGLDRGLAAVREELRLRVVRQSGRVLVIHPILDRRVPVELAEIRNLSGGEPNREAFPLDLVAGVTSVRLRSDNPAGTELGRHLLAHVSSLGLCPFGREPENLCVLLHHLTQYGKRFFGDVTVPGEVDRTVLVDRHR